MSPSQGHALFTRQAGGDLPCPALDFTGGFNQFLGAAYGLHGQTVQQAYGAPFGESPSLSEAYLLSIQRTDEDGYGVSLQGSSLGYPLRKQQVYGIPFACSPSIPRGSSPGCSAGIYTVKYTRQ